MFEGEFLNGKRHGRGKEYYSNGNLRFKGEYLNDERLTDKLYMKMVIYIVIWRVQID